jgi:hypothetical protein
MIPNVLMTVIGIVLVYAAVLGPAMMQPMNLLVAGAAIIACAVWARMSDHATWFSIANLIAGATLLVLAALQFVSQAPALILFWGVFWSGLIAAIVALWSLLYRPSEMLV